MPADPGPRFRVPQRALWVTPAAVLGVVAVLALAMRLPSAGSSATDPGSAVITAAATTAAPPASGRLEQRAALAPPRLQQPGGERADSRCAGHPIRVLQFNIHYGVSRSGEVDPATLADEIRATRPDLVSLNEVDSGTLRSGQIDEAGYLAEATGLHAVYGPNLLWDGGYFGNAILTRYPVVASRNLRLPAVAGMEPRGLLTATIRVGGRTITFSSMHLSDGTEGRVSRILEAEAVAQVLRGHAQPTILAGDLNAAPDSLPVRIVRQYLLDAQQEGGTGRGDTIPETAPRSRIDYVLNDRHFDVIPGSTRVLPSASSDHRSVFTELRLVPQGGC